MPETTNTPRYQKVKDYIIRNIRSGEWAADSLIPSENVLLKKMNVSRMTVNRAVRELSQEGVLRRVQGLGTFVAGPQPKSVLLELRNIADDIRQRGNQHKSTILTKETVTATPAQAKAFYIEEGGLLFHTVLLHHENDHPIQLEDRLVNPNKAPLYLEIDFHATTPNEYLVQTVPADEVEHIVKASLPTAEQKTQLILSNDEAVLHLHRRTWSNGSVVSIADLFHPGNRFSLGASFNSNNSNSTNFAGEKDSSTPSAQP